VGGGAGSGSVERTLGWLEHVSSDLSYVSVKPELCLQRYFIYMNRKNRGKQFQDCYPDSTK
jgi:hypothetical protein